MKRRRLKKKFKFIIILLIFLFIITIILLKGKNNMNSKKENKNVKVVSLKKENYVIDDILIVNKSYSLSSDYIPQNTYKEINNYDYCVECINKEAYNSFTLMQSDALTIGLSIWIQSGYRSYNYQKELYDSYVLKDGKELADTYSARPGHSEHQTGLAIDLNTIDDSFSKTDEYNWLIENCYKYGYILRYPKGKEDITGYKYESWHYRYVGTDLAKKLYNNGDWITLEEYFNLDSKY